MEYVVLQSWLVPILSARWLGLLSWHLRFHDSVAALSTIPIPVRPTFQLEIQKFLRMVRSHTNGTFFEVSLDSRRKFDGRALNYRSALLRAGDYLGTFRIHLSWYGTTWYLHCVLIYSAIIYAATLCPSWRSAIPLPTSVPCRKDSHENCCPSL